MPFRIAYVQRNPHRSSESTRFRTFTPFINAPSVCTSSVALLVDPSAIWARVHWTGIFHPVFSATCLNFLNPSWLEPLGIVCAILSLSVQLCIADIELIIGLVTAASSPLYISMTSAPYTSVSRVKENSFLPCHFPFRCDTYTYGITPYCLSFEIRLCILPTHLNLSIATNSES